MFPDLEKGEKPATTMSQPSAYVMRNLQQSSHYVITISLYVVRNLQHSHYITIISLSYQVHAHLEDSKPTLGGCTYSAVSQSASFLDISCLVITVVMLYLSC